MRCNILVSADDEPCTREKAILADAKMKQRVKIISLDEFKDMLHIDEEEMPAAAAFSLADVVTLPAVAYGKPLKMTIGEAHMSKKKKSAQKSAAPATAGEAQQPKKKKKRRRRKKKPAQSAASDGEKA